MKTIKIYVLITLAVLSMQAKAMHSESSSSLKERLTAEESNKIWHDLVTPNLDVSKRFYSGVLGWTFIDQNRKGLRYSLIKNGARIIGGVIEIPEAKSSAWITSLVVSPQDMQQKIKLAMASGCKAATKPLKLPGRGKQVIMESPQGEEFAFITEVPSNTTIKSSETGSWIGIELWSSNVEKSKRFYKTNFEVTVEEIMVDKKPYWVFKKSGQDVAGMINNPVRNQGSQWVPYLYVSNPKAILPSVKREGGDVLLAPNNAIRAGKLAIFQDPNGAILCVQTKN